MKDFTATHLSNTNNAGPFASFSKEAHFPASYERENNSILSQGMIDPQNNKDAATAGNHQFGHLVDNNNFCIYKKDTHRNRRNDAFTNLLMAGTYSLTTMHYPNALISHGPLPGAENASATITRDGDILFKWSDNSGIKTARTNDQVMLVTYFPATKQIVYTLHAATRAGCQALLPFNKYRGKTAETWIGFVSHDGRDAGASAYAGRVQL